MDLDQPALPSPCGLDYGLLEAPYPSGDTHHTQSERQRRAKDPSGLSQRHVPKFALLLGEEFLQSDSAERHVADYLIDTHMMVMFGARARTETEIAQLLADSDLAFQRVVPTKAPVPIVEECHLRPSHSSGLGIGVFGPLVAKSSPAGKCGRLPWKKLGATYEQESSAVCWAALTSSTAACRSRTIAPSRA